MVGIVGILLLGSLAWSAVGALVSAVSAAGSALSSAAPRSPATLAPVAAVTPVASPVGQARTPTPQPAGATPAEPTGAPVPTPTVLSVATPTPEVTPVPSPTPAVAARNPWILLPQPEPGARIQPGSIALEARGRGDSPITAMHLELDGAPLPVALEQRSETTWRGSATARVGAGPHTVRATVTDVDGRSGSFRWSFTAAPGP